jgi:hypothetical protein
MYGTSKNSYVLIIVGISTGFQLNEKGVEVRVPVGSRIFTLLIVQTGSWTHPASCPKANAWSFPECKAARE